MSALNLENAQYAQQNLNMAFGFNAEWTQPVTESDGYVFYYQRHECLQPISAGSNKSCEGNRIPYKGKAKREKGEKQHRENGGAYPESLAQVSVDEFYIQVSKENT